MLLGNLNAAMVPSLQELKPIQIQTARLPTRAPLEPLPAVLLPAPLAPARPPEPLRVLRLPLLRPPTTMALREFTSVVPSLWLLWPSLLLQLFENLSIRRFFLS
ncbi:hypothetical protein FS842_011454 [Serendipita sp. 407]|nr:hypothetical protein FS842_011454 [Serendipita sp. 407]